MERELKNKMTGEITEFEKENIVCKICLCDEETVDDPIISPCNCKGYCGYIHTNCLRQWINNKVKK
jgi:E3 ubiquitin-protein ligase DOA10